MITTCLLHPRYRTRGKQRWGKRVLAPAELYIGLQRNDTVNQQHTRSPGLLESQQRSIFCIWRGCTAVPQPVSAKWQHPFFPMKRGGEEKTRSPDLPPEEHPWRRDSSHAHLETTFETFELARGKVRATLSLTQHIGNWSFRIFLTPCPEFVFSAYSRLHRVKKSSEAPALGAAQQTDLAAWDRHVPTSPVTAGSTQTKKRQQKKAFKWVCTKTFQEASFMKGLKINRAAFLL